MANNETGNLVSLLNESYDLRRLIRQSEERLRVVNRRILEASEFPEGKNTAHLSAGIFAAKVQRRFNIAWNQNKLWELRGKFGEDTFWKAFKAELKPRPKEIEALEPWQRSAVFAAKTEKEGTPVVDVILDADSAILNAAEA
jgi:hypothetical protein